MHSNCGYNEMNLVTLKFPFKRIISLIGIHFFLEKPKNKPQSSSWSRIQMPEHVPIKMSFHLSSSSSSSSNKPKKKVLLHENNQIVRQSLWKIINRIRTTTKKKIFHSIACQIYSVHFTQLCIDNNRFTEIKCQEIQAITQFHFLFH